MTIASDQRPQTTRSRNHSEARFSLPAGADDIRARVERVAGDRPELTLLSLDAATATLRRRPNLFSWGETVTVHWSATTRGVDVHITADAKIRTLLGDYGQGRRDIEAIHRALNDTALRR